MAEGTAARSNAMYSITFDGQVTPQCPTVTLGMWAKVGGGGSDAAFVLLCQPPIGVY